ncbi:MAG: hypothetical protein ACKO3P_16260, partial [Planctomycetaceae bacterium]
GIVFGFALLPLFNAQRLIRSGTSTNQMERWVFNSVSATLLMGIPLLMFYYLSMEGISVSSKPAENEPRMTKSHVADWKGLADEVQADREYRRDSNADSEEPRPYSRITNIATQLNICVDPLWSHQGSADPHGVPASNPPKLSKLPDENQASDQTTPVNTSGGVPVPTPAPNPAESRPLKSGSESRHSSPEAFVLLMRLMMSNEISTKLKGDAKKVDLNQLLTERPDSTGSFLGQLFLFPWELVAHIRHGEKRIAAGQPIDMTRESIDRITHAELYDLHQNQLANSLDELIGKQKLIESLCNSPRNSNQTGVYTLRAFNDQFELELARRPAVDDPLLRAYAVGQPIPDELLREEYRAVLLLKLLRHADAIDNNPMTIAGAGHAERLNNWNILRILYGSRIFHSPREIFASNVASSDLIARLKIFLTFLTLFLALGFISVNVTTMQGFYRDQISESWIPNDTPKKQLALHEATPSQTGAPLLLINATVNLHGCPYDGARSRTERYELSPLFVGSERLGFHDTSSFYNAGYTLGEATAISAAAV